MIMASVGMFWCGNGWIRCVAFCRRRMGSRKVLSSMYSSGTSWKARWPPLCCPGVRIQTLRRRGETLNRWCTKESYESARRVASSGYFLHHWALVCRLTLEVKYLWGGRCFRPSFAVCHLQLKVKFLWGGRRCRPSFALKFEGVQPNCSYGKGSLKKEGKIRWKEGEMEIVIKKGHELREMTFKWRNVKYLTRWHAYTSRTACQWPF